MWSTCITRLLGIEIPIVGGTIQWLSRASLVSAVSNAGGLGILSSATCTSKEELRSEIRRTRDLTNKPFAVNINLFPMLRPYSLEEMIDVCHEEKVQIIETSGRSPEPYMKHIKDGKTIHMHKCTRVRDAMKTEALGADLVTIMGIEGGGHPGYEEVTTLVLLPRTVDAVRIPVLAGGGFADGRGLMAALALGAGGIVLGTRLLATEECPIHPAFKKAVLDAEVNSTTLLLRSIKDHRRVLLNYRAQEILEMEARGGALEEILKKMAGQRIKEAYETGDTQGEIFPCGQVAGLIKEILPVRELFQKILHEAEEIHRGRSI